MKYKDFVAWCNDRCCDGLWSMDDAKNCADIIRMMQRLPFWKRKKVWNQVKDDIEKSVLIANERIETLLQSVK